MKKHIKHIYKLYLLIICLLFYGNSTDIYAQITTQTLPFFETLKELQPGAVERPQPQKGSNDASFKKYGLELTSNNTNKFGAVYFDKFTFRSDRGLMISFEYQISGGDSIQGGGIDSNKGGDGLCFFLIDANETNPGIGATGAGLGYGYNRSSFNTAAKLYPNDPQSPTIDLNSFRQIGLKGAYLGIGFDSYGHFKKLFYMGDRRINGIPYDKSGSQGYFSELPSYDGKNDVTLRGAIHPLGFSGAPGVTGTKQNDVHEIVEGSGGANLGTGYGYAGYPVLITQRTTENKGIRLKNDNSYIWEPYNQLNKADPNDYFKVRGGRFFEKSNDPGYRKAFIELYPDGDHGFYITVKIQHGDVLDIIIDNFHYTKSTKYIENAFGSHAQSGYFDANKNNYMYEYPGRDAYREVNMNTSAPEFFKIGFSAATGEEKDRHVIKYLNVSLPRAAVALDDFVADECKGAQEILFKPLLNDYGFRGAVNQNQLPCPECIDGSTFKFVGADGKLTNDNPVIIPGQGKWSYTYNSTINEGIVKFEPDPTFPAPDYSGTGDVTTKLASIQYTVKGGKINPEIYGDEDYRSAPATIGVVINNIPCIPPPPKNPKIISNKMIRSKIRN